MLTCNFYRKPGTMLSKKVARHVWAAALLRHQNGVEGQWVRS
jgi:hypothetical protein